MRKLWSRKATWDRTHDLLQRIGAISTLKPLKLPTQADLEHILAAMARPSPSGVPGLGLRPGRT